ncbi:hypothetical protein ES703_115507 [subsurface metagenome]
MLRLEVIALWADTGNHIGNLLTWELGFPIPDMELAGFLRGIAKHFGESLVGLIYLAILVKDNDPITGLVDKDAPSGRFVSQRFLRLLALGDIAEDTLRGHHLVPNITRRCISFYQNLSAILGQKSSLYAMERLSANNLGKHFPAVCLRVRVDNIK